MFFAEERPIDLATARTRLRAELDALDARIAVLRRSGLNTYLRYSRSDPALVERLAKAIAERAVLRELLAEADAS